MGYGMFEWMGRSADGMSYRSNEESHFGAFGPISGVFSTPTVTCIFKMGGLETVGNRLRSGVEV
jgi:hypothetical protein